MPIPPGRYTLGPGDATLTVRTGRAGAAAKAGHDLRIEVVSWSATLAVGESPAATTLELTANPRSLRVREGTGGLQPLGDDDRAEIERTIGTKVLGSDPIEFRSTRVAPAADGALHVEGDLALAGRRRPIAFDLDAGDRLTATATLRQTDFGIKPYSALFGALKVRDEVEVAVEGVLPAAAHRPT
jgi:polyisoprenoid-binding protein YceI